VGYLWEPLYECWIQQKTLERVHLIAFPTITPHAVRSDLSPTTKTVVGDIRGNRSQSRWKAHYSKMRKRVETVFSQRVNAHIRIGQYQTPKALKVRSALTILAHNLKIWGITA
jgi:hypothetical protein